MQVESRRGGGSCGVAPRDKLDMLQFKQALQELLRIELRPLLSVYHRVPLALGDSVREGSFKKVEQLWLWHREELS